MESLESLLWLEHASSVCVTVEVCGQSTVRAVRVVYALDIKLERPKRYLHLTVDPWGAPGASKTFGVPLVTADVPLDIQPLPRSYHAST